MNQSSEITPDESRSFRKGRIAWPFVFALVAGGVLSTPWLLVPSLAVYVVLTIYLLTWQCPVCKKAYCLRFGLISTGWPYFNRCVHCRARLRHE
jgi:hypothetical protein